VLGVAASRQVAYLHTAKVLITLQANSFLLDLRTEGEAEPERCLAGHFWGETLFTYVSGPTRQKEGKLEWADVMAANGHEIRQGSPGSPTVHLRRYRRRKPPP
jgi:hypothetical protein